MKKIYGIIAISVFAAIIIAPSLIWGVIVGIGGEDFIQNEIILPIESEDGENRRAMTLSDIVKGKTNEDGTVEPFKLNDLTGNIEKLYNDFAPFRNDLVAVQAKMMTVIEEPYKTTIGPALVELFYGNKDKEEQIQQDTTGVNMDDIFGPSKDTTDATTEPEIPSLVPDSEIIGGDAGCEHVFGEAVEEIPASCDEHGSTLADCSKCGAQQRVYTEALGHNYVEIFSDLATCTKTGTSHQVCSRCRKERDVTLPVLSHDPKFIEKVATSYYDCGYDLYECNRCGLTYRENIVPKLIDTSIYPVSYNGSRQVIYGRYGWLFYTGDNLENYYVGSGVLPESHMKMMTEMIDDLNTECQKRGITLVIAFWPNKGNIYSEYLPTYEKKTETNKSEALIKYINENSKTGVKAIYPKTELMAAKNYYQTYFKYDTHWNYAGGFMGAQAIYNALGMETTDIRTIKAVPTTAKRKDLYANMLSKAEQASVDLSDDKDYLFDYRPEINILEESGSGANKEFVSSGDVLYTKSSNENGKKLVFFGDSYRNAITPFLKKDFTYTTITHINNVPSFTKEILDCDVLVLSRVSRKDETIMDAVMTLTVALKNAK